MCDPRRPILASESLALKLSLPFLFHTCFLSSFPFQLPFCQKQQHWRRSVHEWVSPRSDRVRVRIFVDFEICTGPVFTFWKLPKTSFALSNFELNKGAGEKKDILLRGWRETCITYSKVPKKNIFGTVPSGKIGQEKTQKSRKQKEKKFLTESGNRGSP